MIKLALSFFVSALVAGTGVGLIAQESKPDNTLYPLKLAVNEKITGIFSVDYITDVNHHLDLIEIKI